MTRNSTFLEKGLMLLAFWHNIPTRYPDALPGIIPSEAFDKDDAERAISLAEKNHKLYKIKNQGRVILKPSDAKFA